MVPTSSPGSPPRSMDATVLIVDDQPTVLRVLTRALKTVGVRTATARSGAEARAKLASLRPELLLLDLQLPDLDGTEILDEVRSTYPDTDVIVITGHASIPSTVHAIRSGAVDYLAKPFEAGELVSAVRRALQAQVLRNEVARLRSDSSLAARMRTALNPYLSTEMSRLMQRATRVAEQETLVVLRGESGTGKDRLARWLHGASKRRDGPFFALNCAALRADLVDDELFGHEPGAGGAERRKRGLLELADTGTLLLNEIGDVDRHVQTRLLSFLDTKSFVRVGGEHAVHVDTRILVATQFDLEAAVAEGRFREDLFHRLNVVTLWLPPLRERLEDLPLLANEFIDELCLELGRPRASVTADALRAMEDYVWPGNVRELRNVMERALILSDELIDTADLNLPSPVPDFRLVVDFPSEGQTLRGLMQLVSRALIAEALHRGGSSERAAELLGTSPDVLAQYAQGRGGVTG